MLNESLYYHGISIEHCFQFWNTSQPRLVVPSLLCHGQQYGASNALLAAHSALSLASLSPPIKLKEHAIVRMLPASHRLPTYCPFILKGVGPWFEAFNNFVIKPLRAVEVRGCTWPVIHLCKSYLSHEDNLEVFFKGLIQSPFASMGKLHQWPLDTVSGKSHFHLSSWHGWF